MIRLARQAAWAPIAVVVLHWLLARRFGHEPYVDPVSHFAGGAAIAFFFRRACALRRDRLGRPSRPALDLIALGCAIAAASVWEFGEWAIGSRFGFDFQRGLPDTTRDLILGASGALVYLLLALFFRGAGTKAAS